MADPNYPIIDLDDAETALAAAAAA